MTSVEFYDAKTGAWLTLPRFQIVGFFFCTASEEVWTVSEEVNPPFPLKLF